MDKDRFLATNKIFNLLILAASAFIVTISSISSVIPNDMEFKKLLKNHILSILKDSSSVVYVLITLVYELCYCITVSRYDSSLLPNVVDQAVKDSNEYLESQSRPPLSQDIVKVIETQVLSIKEPDHKIRALVGRCIINHSFIISMI